MLTGLKIVYSCNHVVNTLFEDVVIKSIIKSDSNIDALLDLTVDKGVVSEIYSVYKNLPDGTIQSYYENIDFVVSPNNISITWYEEHIPSAGDVINVEFKNTYRETAQYVAEDCPKCGGSGWYVSLFDDSVTNMKKITGVNKLVQEFLKMLLTYKIDTYGSTLLDAAGKELSDEVTLSSDIASTVFDCENQYKQIQLTDINSGVLMEDSERLRSASLTSIEIDDSEGAIFVSIVLTSEEDDVSQINLMI